MCERCEFIQGPRRTATECHCCLHEHYVLCLSGTYTYIHTYIHCCMGEKVHTSTIYPVYTHACTAMCTYLHTYIIEQHIHVFTPIDLSIYTQYLCEVADSVGTYTSAPSVEKSTIKKLEKSLLALSLHLSHCLFHENEEVVLETARVLG